MHIHSMIDYSSIKVKENKPFYQSINTDWLSKTLIKATILSTRNKTRYQLIFLEKLLNFVRFICIAIIQRNFNQQEELLLLNGQPTKTRIEVSLLELLFNFDILTINKGKIAIPNIYQDLIQLKGIEKIINGKETNDVQALNRKCKKVVNDFLFINDLIYKYRNIKYPFVFVKKDKKAWHSLLENKKLDYEIRLCETLKALVHLRLSEKIKSPFDESYYTESGRNAFKNFTQYRFLDCVRHIAGNKQQLQVLDIGCGYGNYIEVLQEKFPDYRIAGIEKNHRIFTHTEKQFKANPKITILERDFFTFTSSHKYDLILLNYIMFYFNAEEKFELLQKAKNMLATGGSMMICQYFAGIENLKKELAKKQNDFSLSRKIEMHYSNKVLYANTLWNDSVDTFSESVKWDELLDILSALDLQIVSLTNADKFYYSLFIEIKNQFARA